MIIVSQDKEEIVNFDLICNMFVFGSGIRCMLADGSDTIIGEYGTQERAKEVLQEIIKTHKISESYKYTRDVGLQSALTADIEMRNLILFRYEMPEK